MTKLPTLDASVYLDSEEMMAEYLAPDRARALAVFIAKTKHDG